MNVMGRISFGSKLAFLRAFLFCELATHITTISDVDVPVRVGRRISGDIYYVTSSSYSICHDNDNVTFLVSERRCVKNQDLFNGNLVFS